MSVSLPCPTHVKLCRKRKELPCGGRPGSRLSVLHGNNKMSLGQSPPWNLLNSSLSPSVWLALETEAAFGSCVGVTGQTESPFLDESGPLWECTDTPQRILSVSFPTCYLLHFLPVLFLETAAHFYHRVQILLSKTCYSREALTTSLV